MDRLGAMVRTAAALCLRGGCGERMRRRRRPSAPPPRAAAARPRRGRDRRADRRHAVRGSGFVIDGERGLVLTAAHSVWGARSLKLSTGLGVLHGRIVARAPCDDLALLELLPADSRAGGAADRAGRLHAATSSCARSAVASDPAAAAAAREHPGADDLVPGASSAELPLPSAGIPLDSPLVPEVSGGPVVDQAGRLVGMAQAMGAPASPHPRCTCRGRASAQRLDELRPGPRSDLRRLGGAVPLRRPPARVRARHAPRLPARATRASTRRSRRRGSPAPKGWTADVGGHGVPATGAAAAALGDRRRPAS